ncbi:MAG: ABC transporter substrate-binding protein [Lachnospiraceae bacterium]|jgi:4,5-dihydroxyphthalate decarboxylase
MAKKVKIVLATNAHTRPLKEGIITSPDVELEFTEYKGVPKAAEDMLDGYPFDVCEMPLVTLLQAFDAKAKVKLLPIVMVGEFHHGSCWYRPGSDISAPADVKGKKIGVRAYTQTTGAWVRGVLSEQFGVASKDVTWVTTEPPHVATYVLPENVEVVPGADLEQMVRDDELAAVIQGTKQGVPEGLAQLVPNLPNAIATWYEKNKCVPINHMVVVKDDMDEKTVAAVYEMLTKAVDQAYPVDSRPEPFPYVYNIEGVWPAVEIGMKYCLEQGLIERLYTKEEIFAKGVK